MAKYLTEKYCLKVCVLGGSVARLRKTEVAKNFMQKGGTPSHARQVAAQAIDNFFAAEGDKLLDTTCP